MDKTVAQVKTRSNRGAVYGPLVLCIAMALAPVPNWSQTLSNEPPALDRQRLQFAETVIEKFGTQMSPASREAILRQQVVLGMPPYEASLAAGAYTFEVKADPSRWPPGADPYRVIAAQSLHPDDSHISCVFRNATQFPGRGVVRFKVVFRAGRAVQIDALD